MTMPIIDSVHHQVLKELKQISKELKMLRKELKKV